MRKLLLILLLFLTYPAFPQATERFLSDTALAHASFSMYVADAISEETILDLNSGKSLTPASVLKLVTSAAALELLGPGYKFTTKIGYTGTITRGGKLNGNIIIKGGGDPAFASLNFPEYYGEFPGKWTEKIISMGIKKIKGRVITDDSYYDYLPVPSKWLWEDAGNYYGAGVYGASVYDNAYDIHFRTFTDSTIITGFVPEECRFEFTNRLRAAGTTDQGYVFTAPYSRNGWIAGSIPPDRNDFVLGASITDPPLLLSKIIDGKLGEKGIGISDDPSTVRIQDQIPVTTFTTIAEIVSPPLTEILEILNHESVNLYAEHLVKELGKQFKGTGSTAAGIDVIKCFLDSTGVAGEGMFIVDGSGLSPLNSINAKGLSALLIHMKKHGKYSEHYLNSLPDAGKEGTLKNYFKGDIFNNCLKAKSGSMTRVRSYAGYFTTRSGREMVFAFITNDFTGSAVNVVTHYERILEEIILTK